MAIAAKQQNWLARLNLIYVQKDSRTVLGERSHVGPLVVQKPFYPEGSTCHTYILHPPGGVVGGDRLIIDIQTKPGTHALITTPAANKFYRTKHQDALVRQTLMVDRNSVLEWLPQESILFKSCSVDTLTRVELDEDAKFIGWEVACLGRPASAELFDHGTVRQRFELWRQHKPLLIERSRLDGGSDMLQAQWGLQGYSVTGTMIAFPADKNTLDAVRSLYDNSEPCLFSVTLINDILVCRCLGHGGEQVRNKLTQAWALIRPMLLNRNACIPRIWHT